MLWIQLNEIDTALFEKSGQSFRTIVNIESSHLLDWYSFLLIVRLTVLHSVEAQQIKCNSSQLIIGSQNRLTFSSLLFPTKSVATFCNSRCRNEIWLFSVDVSCCFWNPFEKYCSNTLQSIEAQMKCDTTDLALLFYLVPITSGQQLSDWGIEMLWN